MTQPLRDVAAITFDFGNTLVPVGRAALRGVVDLTADAVVRDQPAVDREAFLTAWVEERERQFRENVPQFREVDLSERLVRVFARLRGMPPPAEDESWDQARAATYSEPGEVSRTVEAYSRAFVAGLPPADGVDDLLGRLAADGRVLAILSNWPLAATIDRYAEARGWLPFLRAIVVSERVGVIKPHPAIFAAAATALGDPPMDRILHVGDDWAADVVGASDVGWRTAWVTDRPADTPLPTSAPDAGRRADLELAAVAELDRWLDPIAGDRRTATG